jgi:hypothetical protein
VTFISIHSVIIYVVFFGACMRCTRLCSLKPGCDNAMVISCVIKGFLVHNVLVDTGSAADIIFAKAFRQMQELEDKIHDATHPLCGFGGRQIVALGKMTMSIAFGYVHNTRSEQVSLTSLTWNTHTMQSLVEGHLMPSKPYSTQHTCA